MIGYGAVLSLNLFSGKWWYTNIFTNSNIQVSHTFTIIGLIAESTLKLIHYTRSKIFGNLILEMKVLPNLVLFLNTICNLQQLRMFFNDFFNLVLVCKDTEPRYGSTVMELFNLLSSWSWDWTLPPRVMIRLLQYL